MIKFLSLFLIFFEINCNLYNNPFDKSSVELLNILLFESNIFDINKVANRRVSGTLLNIDNTPISDATLSVVSRSVRIDISSQVKTDRSGNFTIFLTDGMSRIRILSSLGVELGNIELSISNNGAIEGNVLSGALIKISNLTSIFIYPNGATTPVSISAFTHSTTYVDEINITSSTEFFSTPSPGDTTYMNIEIVNNTPVNQEFISSTLTSSNGLVSILNPNQNFPGTLRRGEYLSLYKFNNRTNFVSSTSNSNYSTASNIEGIFKNSRLSSFYYKINLATNTPMNGKLDFTLKLNQRGNNQLELPFSIPFPNKSTNLNLGNFAATTSFISSTQRNVFINPIFQNVGEVSLFGLTVSLTSTSPQVSNITNGCTFNLGTLRPGFYQSVYRNCRNFTPLNFNFGNVAYTSSTLGFRVNSAPPLDIPITISVIDSNGNSFSYSRIYNYR